MVSSTPSTFLPVLLVLLVLLLATFYLRRLRSRDSFSLPPSPSTIPFIGNLLGIPRNNAAQEYARWSKNYNSDMVSWTVFGTTMIILNTAEVAKDLLERRSSIYSDRPKLELMMSHGWTTVTGFLPYSDQWRRHRRLHNHSLRANVIPRYRDAQFAHVRSLLKAIIERPEQILYQARLHSGSFGMKLVYGVDTNAEAKKWIDTTEEVMRMVETSSAAAVVVDIFPSLLSLPEWTPGIGKVKARAARSRLLLNEMSNGPFNVAREAMGEMRAQQSLIPYFMKIGGNQGKYQPSLELMKEVMTATHVGASDTSKAAIASALLALVLHPAVQVRAQSELDEGVGRDRLPDFSDQSRLPFIEAICREVFRWKVVLPLGVPHATTEDDIYKGYLIPKGAIVVGNAWAILHNPEIYSDPESFKPERFITKDGKLSDDDVLASFGFGRRICPGRHLANTTLWITVASILSVFTIRPAKDKDGNNIPINPGYTTEAAINHPLPFACTAVLRDEKAEALIKNVTEDSPVA